ncbi:AraC family transcriptional regulator [Labrys sp. WJW]|uniref:AraC family transcriptional regulator n=1 Tax=Labrys sp. WJW TaxID=1737983 RepID=UPI00082A2169|nr:AraC family transcriptional regulator [Labrys sp. WJW]
MLYHSSGLERVRRDNPPADLMSELLLGMRLNGVQYRRLHAAPPFGVHFGTVEGRAQFHFVACGTVYLRMAGGAVHSLGPGDAVLLPRGGEHCLVSAPDLPSQDVGAYEAIPLCKSVSAVSACVEETCPSQHAHVFSGCMEFDLGGMHPLIAQMPEVMLVGTLLERQPEIEPMLRAMEREVLTERVGSAGILARLADVVSASIVRGWVECGCGETAGWLDALRDPRLSRAIGALHRDPGRDWTVAELAQEMGASRSVFAERFLAVTGQTPLRYVTELRMRLAAEWIGRDRMSIDTAAQRLGYASQAAFSRAFKRVTGRPPGALRTEGPLARA